MLISRLTEIVFHGSSDRQARPARTKQLKVKGLKGLAKDVFSNGFLMMVPAETIDLLA